MDRRIGIGLLTLLFTLGSAEDAFAESFLPDSGMCWNNSECSCGYVCQFGSCQ